MNVLVSGDRGFIGQHVVAQLLKDGHVVVGMDSNVKYGPQQHYFDTCENYTEYELDASNVGDVSYLLEHHAIDYFIMLAARIGGISYFHAIPYTLLSDNMKLMAAQFDAAVKYGKLKRVVVLSSSMVYESAVLFPSHEGDELRIPPPSSSYGFQKLSCEYFARAAQEQFGLEYTIVRPFNCVGIGESRAVDVGSIRSGDIQLAMSHVIPDLIQKLAKGQRPLHIFGDGSQVRHYTAAADLARGITLAMLAPAAANNDYNLSTGEQTTVLEVAAKVWEYFYPGEPLEYLSYEPFKHDVQMRVPSVDKAFRDLGWKAETTLDEVLRVVVPHIRQLVDGGVM